MKLNNGLNIITDADITMTGAKNIGHSLSEVINKQEEDISRLNSNVKWIYKYGGVGSGGPGGGGGGGDSSAVPWNFRVSVDLVTYDSNTEINLGTPGIYTLDLKLYKVQGKTFNITITYDTDLGLKKLIRVINPDTPPTLLEHLNLQVNGLLTIVIEDDEGNFKNYQVTYIVQAYSFTVSYVRVRNGEYQPFNSTDNNIFIGDFTDDEGKPIAQLMIDFHYIISTDITNISLDCKDWTDKTFVLNQENEDKLNDKLGHLYLPVGIGDLVNEMAGNYNYTIDVHLTLKNSDKEEEIPLFKLLDNVIPSSIYLKVESDGTIYNTSGIKNPATFFTGAIAFRVTPFLGALSIGEIYILDVTINDRSYRYDLIDQKELLITVVTSLIGENKITFKYERRSEVRTDIYYFYTESPLGDFNWYPSQKLEGAERSFTNVPSLGYLYIYGQNIYNDSDKRVKPFPGLNLYLLIHKKMQDPDKVLYIDHNESLHNKYNKYDCLISIGLNFSNLNNSKEEFIKITGKDRNCDINIFLDKITLGRGDSATAIKVYIPKDNEFHQLTIYKRAVGKTGTSKLYEIAIYIDGVLEKTSLEFVLAPEYYYSVALLKGLYQINFLEISYFKHTPLTDDSLNDMDKFNLDPNKYNLDYMNDLGILYHYYSYNLIFKHTLSEMFKTSYALASKFYYNRYTDRIMVTDLVITSIATELNIPILLVEYLEPQIEGQPGTNGKAFFLWMENTYDITKNPNILKNGKQVTVSWSPGKSKLNGINLSANAYFKLYLLGTSTLLYKNKNFDLALEHVDTVQNQEYFYTPNFDANNPETFLPEKRFTLKADMVDSSHSNNNALGKFINTVTTKFEGAKLPGHPYSNYIKNTLEGFPFLMFIKNKYYVGEELVPRDDTYFMGIYNFNLGRDSEFNLGYKDLNLLPKYMPSGFNIISIIKDDTSNPDAYKSGFGVAEVMENENYFDFSLADDSILYQFDGDENDTGQMFGKIKSADVDIFKSRLKTMVDNVGLASGYIFDTLHKNMLGSDKNGGYKEGYKSNLPRNLVPNYRLPYKRVLRDALNILELDKNKPLRTKGTSLDLIRTILGEKETEDSAYLNPYVDYRAVSEYYVCCMALGLVDSVLKNLNLKTWNGTTFYPSFYDMDTALGKDNAGADTHYMAFSDYWIPREQVIGATHYLEPAMSYKDWYDPNAEKVKPDEELLEGEVSEAKIGYDVPINYLLALAKYAHHILYNSANEELKPLLKDWYPSNLWARMRRKDPVIVWENGQLPVNFNAKQVGCLLNAKYFIDNFFLKHLSNIPDAFLNLNYRKKYFVIKPDVLNGYNSTDESKFSGRRIHYVQDWLDGRLHILDLYFNLASVKDSIKVCDLDTGNWKDIIDIDDKATAYYALPDPVFIDTSNPDILVVQDIFHPVNELPKFSSNIDLFFKSEDNSPLSFTGNSFNQRYIVPETPYGKKQEMYRLLLKSAGDTVNLGGSRNWTWVDKINTVIKNDSIFIDSDKLTSIIGDAGRCSSWKDIKAPAVENIALTSPGYTGSLEFAGTESWPNLKEVNISGSHLGITLSNLDIVELLAANIVTTANLTIANCKRLKTINLSKSIFGSISMKTSEKGVFFCPYKYKIISNEKDSEDPDKIVWEKTSIDANSPKCTILQSENINGGYSAIFIEDLENIESISLTGYSKIYIKGCPKLREINISDAHRLRDLTVTECSGASIYGLKINSEHTERFVDLTACTSLRKLYMYKTKGFDVVHVGSAVELALNAFYWTSIKYLKSVNGHPIKLSTYTFHGSGYTLLDGPGGNLTTFNKTETVVPNSLEGVFSYCNVSLDTFNKFNLEYLKLIEKTTNVRSMWTHNNLIYYDYKLLELDLKAGVCSINLSMYTNVIYADYMLENPKNNSCHPDIFKNFGINSTSISLRDFYGWRDNSLHIIYIPIDWLKHIKEKYSDINLSNTVTKFIVLLSNSIEPQITFKIPLLFPPNSNIQILENWNFDKLHTIDLSDNPFTKYTNLKTLLRCFCDCNGINLTIDKTNYGFLLLLGGVRNILGCFGFLNKPLINLNCLAKWSSLPPNGLFLYIEYWDEQHHVGESPKKIVSPKEFNNIYGYVLGSTNVNSVAHLFRNCTVYPAELLEGNVPIELSPKKIKKIGEEYIIETVSNTVVENFPYLFDNLKVFNSIEQVPAQWDWLMFKYIPNILNLKCTFRNNYFNNAIPFNVFYKRKENPATTVYVYVNGVYKAAKLHSHSYHSHISNMRECFKGCLFNPDACCFILEDNNLSGINKKNRVEYSEGGKITEYFEYYTFVDGSGGKRVKNPEYDDMYREIEYTEDILDILVNKDAPGLDEVYKNFEKLGKLNKHLNAPFIAPDIFYGCTSSADLRECFLDCALLGFIPDNLLLNCKGALINNFAKNVLIFPKVYTSELQGLKFPIEEYKYMDKNHKTLIHLCYYLGHDFSQASNLDNAFNFRIGLPGNIISEEVEGVKKVLSHSIHVFSFIDSFSSSLSSCVDAFPNFINGLSNKDSLRLNIKNEFNYNGLSLMYDHTKEKLSSLDPKVIDLGKFGFDCTRYNKMSTNRLYNGLIIQFAYGMLFDENSTLDSLRMNRIDNNNYIIRVGNEDKSGVLAIINGVELFGLGGGLMGISRNSIWPSCKNPKRKALSILGIRYNMQGNDVTSGNSFPIEIRKDTQFYPAWSKEVETNYRNSLITDSWFFVTV